jgi:hypothetical protein
MTENKDVFTSRLENAENERLRKAWFNHVISTLEKLDENIDKVNTELYNKTSELYKEIQSVKDLLYKELKDVNKSHHDDVCKLEKRVEKLLYDIESKIKNLSVPSVKEELKKDIVDVKDNFADKLDPIKTAVTKINVKLTMWALFAGIIGGWVIPAGIRWIVAMATATPPVP